MLISSAQGGGGGEGERERWRKTEGKRETTVFLTRTGRRRHRTCDGGRRQEPSDRGKGGPAEEEQSQKGDLEASLFSRLCSCACWQKCPKRRLSSDKCDV